MSGFPLSADGGGGGGEPASPDTSVQFNDGGSFGGSDMFRWDDNISVIYLGDEGVSSGIRGVDATTSNTEGGGLTISGGNGVGTAAGGDVSLGAGGSGGDENGGGGIQLGGGQPASGGNITIGGGNGEVDNPGGSIDINGGTGGGTSGAGGSVSLTAGSAQGGDSNGGNIDISTGFRTGSGDLGRMTLISEGDLVIESGQPTRALLLNKEGEGVRAIFDVNSITANRTFTFPNRSGYLAVATQGADVGSANNLSLGADGNVFEITGTTQNACAAMTAPGKHRRATSFWHSGR